MRRLLIAAFLITYFVTPAAAQAEEGFFEVFHFKTLSFRFDPTGSTNEANSKKGSALELFADEVEIRDLAAEDIRECIDRNPECDYTVELGPYYKVGDNDGTVEANEVAAFKGIAAAAAGLFYRVQTLSASLEENITVDGKHATNPQVVSLELVGAEGPVATNKTIMADVTMRMTFDNDKAASKHEIVISGLSVDDEGFNYQTVEWTLIGDQWDYKSDATKPAAYKAKVTGEGWKSNQADFQAATEAGLTLMVEKVGGKKKTPAPDALLALAVVAAAMLVLRRKT